MNSRWLEYIAYRGVMGSASLVAVSIFGNEYLAEAGFVGIAYSCSLFGIQSLSDYYEKKEKSLGKESDLEKKAGEKN